ncbi:MAG: hypothetical protein JW734_03040 [Candidatus Omnitrophica bacterium]|nr:hypothetical protein [Candidatus Omnitrophota bacterium]
MTDKKIKLARIREDKLLNCRICDLPLQIEGTWIESCVNQLYSELEAKGIKFKPLCYLADEWLTPDNEPVVGIAFFLAHPRLVKLEKKMMLEVEGGTKDWCMKLLRHESGHALNYAFKLYKRRKWQEIFGRFSQEYADTYRFRPYSRSFVRHLEDYYAQYHPDEDFAETFAVWLAPKSKWPNQYKGWKALGKLKYVDKLMSEISNKEPFKKKGEKYWCISRLKIKLKNYYKKKKQFWAEYFPDFHDSNLKRIFVEKDQEHKDLPLACEIIKKHKKNILSSISTWTGERRFIIDDLLRIIIDRCRDLKLVAVDLEVLAAIKISIYITTLIMNYSYTGRFRKKK